MQRGWRALLVVGGVVGAASCAQAGSSAERSAARPREPVAGLPCEGCEAVFVGLPSTFAAQARIAPVGEAGEPLVIRGTVFAADGRPAAGVIVYVYQADARGLYPPDPGGSGRPSVRHGRLRGWAQTDAAGEYRFDTIRPAIPEPTSRSTCTCKSSSPVAALTTSTTCCSTTTRASPPPCAKGSRLSTNRGPRPNSHETAIAPGPPADGRIRRIVRPISSPCLTREALAKAPQLKQPKAPACAAEEMWHTVSQTMPHQTSASAITTNRG